MKIKSEQISKNKENFEKENRKLTNDIRTLRELINSAEFDKEEQERMAWKLQDQVDRLTENLGAELKARSNAIKLMKGMEVEFNNNKETLEETLLNKTRLEVMQKDLKLGLEAYRDILEEEKDKNRELIIFRDQSKNSIREIKNALHREISTRESLENDRRNLERENQVTRDGLDLERVKRSNMERDIKRSIDELEDFRARIQILSNAVLKSEALRENVENDEHNMRKNLNELNRSIAKDNEEINKLESEVRKLQQQRIEVQDIATNFESEQRRSEVEIAGLRETIQFVKEELERVKTDVKTVNEEKQDLEDKARSLSSLLKK